MRMLHIGTPLILAGLVAGTGTADQQTRQLAAAAASAVTVRNVQQHEGQYRLTAGPNVEGVVMLNQGRWSVDQIRTFHAIPWLDAASVRIRWADLEPHDQQFDFAIAEQLLAEVKKYNASHPGVHRTLHIRVMGGVHVPKWFEPAGVRFYDTQDAVRGVPGRAIRIPIPYDNPQYLKQLREVYRAMYERFHDEPLVTVYHGTWSAGPWDEIFHPQGSAPPPPGYTPRKFVQGMIEQLNVLIDEFSARGKVAELPYSGKYPAKTQIDITGPLTARIVERLGRRSPLLYIQSNGWGVTDKGGHTISWGHERDVSDAFRQVNLAFQAIGTNAGRGWIPQGDWIGDVQQAEQYEAAYLEIYPPDLTPLDTKNRIVEAFTYPALPPGTRAAEVPQGFVGFRPWLAKRARVLYVREGTVCQRFTSAAQARGIAQVKITSTRPNDTWVKARVRVALPGGPWSEWVAPDRAADLPPFEQAEVEVTLHTDDGYVSPRLQRVEIDYQ